MTFELLKILWWGLLFLLIAEVGLEFRAYHRGFDTIAFGSYQRQRAEPDAPMNAETARAIKNAIESLASFLGAQAVDYAENIPDGWKPTLRTM